MRALKQHVYETLERAGVKPLRQQAIKEFPTACGDAGDRKRHRVVHGRSPARLVAEAEQARHYHPRQ